MKSIFLKKKLPKVQNFSDMEKLILFDLKIRETTFAQHHNFKRNL